MFSFSGLIEKVVWPLVLVAELYRSNDEEPELRMLLCMMLFSLIAFPVAWFILYEPQHVLKYVCFGIAYLMAGYGYDWFYKNSFPPNALFHLKMFK